MKLPSPPNASCLAPVHPLYLKLPVWLEPQVLAYGKTCAESMREACYDVVANANTPDCGGWDASGMLDGIEKLEVE